MHERCCKLACLFHVLGPRPELLVVPVDSGVAGQQIFTRSCATVDQPEVILLDEMVDQPIAQVHQLLEAIACSGVVVCRHLDVHPESEGDDVTRCVVTQDLAPRAFRHDIVVQKPSDQCPQRSGCSILNAGIPKPFQRVHRAGKLVMRYQRFEEALVLLQTQ